MQITVNKKLDYYKNVIRMSAVRHSISLDVGRIGDDSADVITPPTLIIDI